MDNNSDYSSENSENSQDNQDIQNFEFIYSPRTEYSNKLDQEEVLFNDLTLNFDPITIKIVKKHFKERLGSLNKDDFISILKNHLLSWHQELPNREKMLIKLLGRLFSEVDLNDNGSMEWAEFTNYIIHNSNSNSNNKCSDNTAFRLRWYFSSKTTIENKEITENISYAFYIEKFNMIGIVQDGKSTIHFFDANTSKLLKCSIELKEVQKDIDDLEFRELEEKAENQRKMEEEEKEKKRMQRLGQRKSYMEKIEKKRQFNATRSSSKREYERPWYTKFMKRQSSSGERSPATHKKKAIHKEVERTPENLKKDLDKIRRAQTVTSKSGISKKLTALCSVFLNEFDVLLVSSSNNKISAWKYTSGEFKNVNTIREHFNLDKNFFLCSILMSSSPQSAMAWDPIQRHLYTGQNDGKVLKWELNKSFPVGVLDIAKAKLRKESERNKTAIECDDTWSENGESSMFGSRKNKLFDPLLTKNQFLSHFHDLAREHNRATKEIRKQEYEKRDSVSCILLLGKIQLLAVSYFNGHIILWDTLLMDYRKYYYDQETGVYSMTYDSSKNLIFTCGFNHKIYVYDPYIDNCAVYKLPGHNNSINSIVCNEKDAELISLDILGTIKVWDTQLLINFQTINLNEAYESKKDASTNKKIESSLRMIYLKKPKKIMVYGNNILFYETGKSLNPELADDQIIFACFYDRITKSILSFCLQKIKIWNPFTGKLKKVYDDPMNNEITAYTIDRNMKRSFLGDNTGKIKNFNMKNGKHIKDLASHSVEINMLCHSLALNIVVSCSIDNVIKIHDDKELMESTVIKEIFTPGNQVKAIAIFDKFSRLAIGLSNGIIRFYDIEHFRFDSDLHSEANVTSGEIICIAPLEGVEIIFSGHAGGLCKFMITPPSTRKFEDFGKFYNYKDTEEGFALPITCVDFDFQNERMFTGDQMGYVKCYSIKEIYDKVRKAKEKDIKRNDNDPILTQDIIEDLLKVSIPLLWSIEAHKESIKHIKHVNIEPHIIITTSHDLKIRLFSADHGEYIDELKQISSKYKPVPIGIKYRATDLLQTRRNKKDIEQVVMRKDINPLKLQFAEEMEGLQISEYIKKNTEHNAKEKLWQQIKGSNVTGEQSNRWNFMIDIKKVQEEEENELRDIYAIVKQKEALIRETERNMNKFSIYHEAYKPLFVNEMDDKKIKEFSNLLSQKLRHVKNAISKANLGQNKFANIAAVYSKNEDDAKKNIAKTHTGAFFPKEKETVTNKAKLNPIDKTKIKSPYAFVNNKNLTPAEEFVKCKNDFEKGISQLQKPFEMLVKKTKVRPLTSQFGNQLVLDDDQAYIMKKIFPEN